MDQMQDKVVVITGGSDGIGKALVELYLNKGAKVATCARNYQKLYQLQSANTGKPLFIHATDVSREIDCKGFIEAVIKEFGTIDIYCTKFALDPIIKNKGTIVGVSSIAGYRGLPGRSGYSASKYAVNGWLEALRTELLESGTNVMRVCPGFTSSNIRNAALNSIGESQGESPMDEGAMMSSEECAGHIANAIEKRKRTLVLTFTGKRAVFMNKFFPALADKLVRKFFFKNNELVK